MKHPVTALRHVLEMIRFSHTLFALPFALLAAVMAWAAPSPAGQRIEFRWLHLAGILVCMVFARSAAMAFNRIADRHLDASNPRTRGRHLPAGLLTVRSVVLFTILCSLGFIAGTLLFWPNPLPVCLAVPVLAFLLGYSYTKRFTMLAHFWLGAALDVGPHLGLDCLARRVGVGRACRPRSTCAAGACRAACGSPGLTSSTPARMWISTCGPSCAACRRNWAWRQPCGWPRAAMWRWSRRWPRCRCWRRNWLWSRLLVRNRRGGHTADCTNMRSSGQMT